MYVAKSKKDQSLLKHGSFNILIYFIAFLAPIMTLSQLMKVWVDKEIAGVSPITWGAYALIALLWMFYGIKHKEIPLIYGNALIFIVDSLIVFGVYIHS